MKSLTICLPDAAYNNALIQANGHGLDIPHLCSGILADYFLSEIHSITATRTKAKQESPLSNLAAASASHLEDGKFDVAGFFRGFPPGSIELAQTFVDEALKQPHVLPFKKGRGIGFKPNYVFIEYLMRRGGTAGIGVSFYGEPQRHKNPPSFLIRGIPSYSRARIRTASELKAILPHIRQSYELKFGSAH